MKVIIQGKQLRLTRGLKAYAEEHVVRPLQRFYDDEAAELRVELGDVNGRQRGGNDMECHLTFRMPGSKAIQIEEVTPDPYASMDAAADRLVRVAKKELSRLRKPARSRKYRPLATAVAEGGVPGGLIEDLPSREAARPASRPKRPAKRNRG